MTQRRIPAIKSEQRVDNAAVAYIDLRRFHQSLADIGVEGRQAPHQQKINKQVEIAGDCLAINAETTRELCRIERAALHMSQHRPELEKALIVSQQPLLNIQGNPCKLAELTELRKKCRLFAID